MQTPDVEDAVIKLIGEQEQAARRGGSIIMLGVISAIRADGFCRVKFNEDGEDGEDEFNITPWIRWKTPASGAIKIWIPPSLGEACEIRNWGGGEDSSTAYAVPGNFSDDDMPPSNNLNAVVVTMPNGVFFEIDHAAKSMRISVPDSIAFTTKNYSVTSETYSVSASAAVNFTSPELNQSGVIKAGGDIFAEAGGKNVSVAHHGTPSAPPGPVSEPAGG